MAFDRERVETVTVDSYGTLVDPDAAADALAPYTRNAAETESVLTQWRSRYLAYVMICNYVDNYRPFDVVIEHGLGYALDAHGIEVSATEREGIMAVYDELAAFDDVKDGLERVSEAGYGVHVLSMGTPEMLTSMIEGAGIGEYVEEVISVDEIGVFKPASEVYRHAAARVGTPIEEILHVAGPSFDVIGAMHAGMQGGWIDRKGDPWDELFDEPDLVLESFDDLAEALEG